ncbi:MAG: YncE family protein [Acidimicrobiia bacterium]|nr:YncE family protein [Acidimicrobiia bacterium]
MALDGRGPLSGLLLAVVVVITSGCTAQSPLSSTGEADSPVAGQSATATIASEPVDQPATSESTTTSLPPTTVPPEPRRVIVEVHPPEAVVELRSGSGFSHRGQGPEPVTVDVPAELVQVRVSAAGYQTYEGELTLADTQAGRSGDAAAEPIQATIWLDRPEQLVHKLFEVEVGGAPKGVAFTPDGSELWTTLLNSNGVEIIDVASGRSEGIIDLGKGAVEVIFNRSGDTAYVSQMETNSVYEIDVAQRTVTRRFNTNGAWTKVMALSPDEKTLYASNWIDSNVSEIDLATGNVTRLLRTVRTPRGLYPTTDGTGLYVTGFETGQLQYFDLATGESEVLLATGGSMRHLVGSPDGSMVYASDMTRDTIFAIDTASQEITELATTDRKPNTIDISPDGRVLFVSNRGANNPQSYYLPGPEWGTVLLIDTASGTMLDAIIGGNQTTGLDVSTDGTLLAFSDLLDNRVVVYSVPPTEQLLAGNGGRYEAHLTELTK